MSQVWPAAQSASRVHSMGMRQKPSTQTWPELQSPPMRQGVLGWQKESSQRSPTAQSLSRVHSGGGSEKQSPPKQLWVGGHSASLVQPPGT